MTRRTAILLFFFYFGAAVLLQWRGNAFSAEFGETEDEAAHYVTGLMVRDYIAQGFPGPPLAYARNYYVHYPKVALGHWPPVFYIVQAFWTLLVPSCHVTLMLLMAGIAALLATILCISLQTEFARFWGVSLGLIFLSLPIVEQYSRDVMAEMLVALLVFLAVLSYGRYLDTERWQSGVWFGIWFGIALLTKGSAIQLALVPPVAVLLTRRIHLITRLSFWVPALAVGAIAGPWYYLVPGAQHETVARFGGVAFHGQRLGGSLTDWAIMLGLVLSFGVLVGLGLSLRQRLRQGKWAAALAALAGAYIARLLIGAFEGHHLLVNLPVLMMFVAVAGDWAWRWTLWNVRIRLATGVASLAALFAINLFSTAPKRHYGYTEVARSLLKAPEFKKSAVLVCSGVDGEGMLISEIAMNESRPGHIILRGSKMLASSDWMSWEYRPRFIDPDQMMNYLESIPAGVVVMDEAGVRPPHCQLLADGLKKHASQWELVAPVGAANVHVYRLIGQENRPPGRIQIPMRSGLYGAFSIE